MTIASLTRRTVLAGLLTGFAFATPALAEDVQADLSLLTPFSDTEEIEHFSAGAFDDTLGFLLNSTNRSVSVDILATGLAFSGGSIFDDDGTKIADLILSGASNNRLSLSSLAVPGAGAFDAFELRLSGDAGAGSFYTINASAAPVPEPATVAMLLAGLATIGVAVQRRRRTG